MQIYFLDRLPFSTIAKCIQKGRMCSTGCQHKYEITRCRQSCLTARANLSHLQAMHQQRCKSQTTYNSPKSVRTRQSGITHCKQFLQPAGAIAWAICLPCNSRGANHRPLTIHLKSVRTRQSEITHCKQFLQPAGAITWAICLPCISRGANHRPLMSRSLEVSLSKYIHIYIYMYIYICIS